MTWRAIEMERELRAPHRRVGGGCSMEKRQAERKRRDGGRQADAHDRALMGINYMHTVQHRRRHRRGEL